MKAFLATLLIAGAMTLGGSAAEQWIGTGTVLAQGSSACFQNCANVRRWPADQCRAYCRGKAKKKS